MISVLLGSSTLRRTRSSSPEGPVMDVFVAVASDCVLAPAPAAAPEALTCVDAKPVGEPPPPPPPPPPSPPNPPAAACAPNDGAPPPPALAVDCTAASW